MNQDIAIYGAGGLGREVSTLVKKINSIEKKWNFIGYFDDGKTPGERIDKNGACLGGINEVNLYPTKLDLILAFGNPEIIAYIRSRIENPNIHFPNVFSPDINIADKETFQLGEGNIICGNCSFSIDNKIGSFNLFNGYTATGHDVEIGDYNVFMPGARISGEVSIGNQNLIGADSFIVQCLKIGNNIKLSPLSALLTKPRDGKVYIGNPAKVFKF